ncbi:MAG: hypothetical protein OEY03_15565, partial [Rhizobacter sp.]|nr:hypothetical protein [Rhizobacter sp.]
MRRRSIVCLTVAALTASAQAADVGGWFSDQQRAAAQAGTPAAAPCAQAIQLAAADPSAIKAYHA